jgi:hypothetical protein
MGTNLCVRFKVLCNPPRPLADGAADFTGRLAERRLNLNQTVRVDFSILCRLFQQECRGLVCSAANMSIETGPALV